MGKDWLFRASTLLRASRIISRNLSWYSPTNCRCKLPETGFFQSHYYHKRFLFVHVGTGGRTPPNKVLSMLNVVRVLLQKNVAKEVGGRIFEVTTSGHVVYSETYGSKL